MGRMNGTGRHIGIFCAGLLLCGLMGLTGGLMGARLAQRYQQPQLPQEMPQSEALESEDIAPAPRWHNEVMDAGQEETDEQMDSLADMVISIPETLHSDTEYVLREKDLLSGSEVETSGEMPDMFIGMNREQFLTAMENYAAAPPLSEKERGFVSLDVLSFAPSRVVVQMNYRYVQPSKSFYVMAVNDLIVVYKEDKETVYQYTNIRLSELPERLQQEIIGVMYIADEESLYDFLESYTS
ncbi:MAG: hypothetical protein NC543_15475 [bacterium]|nr:hypothetical protein [bacterium]MCM1376657.1 hypothetical protein [Muribaculum sp.]